MTRCLAVSSRGGMHKAQHEPCQDACLGIEYPSWSLVTVCDGVGSKSRARFGAKQATLAARDGLRYWARFPLVSTSALSRIIRGSWEARISAEIPEQCATTCLVAAASSEGNLIVGGLGDGIAAIIRFDGTVEQTTVRGQAFINNTIALGAPHQLGDWHWLEARRMFDGDIVLLASDGLADDLSERKIPEFARWIVDEFGGLPTRLRTTRLRCELQQPGAVMNADDKSVAMLWRANKATNQ